MRRALSPTTDRDYYSYSYKQVDAITRRTPLTRGAVGIPISHFPSIRRGGVPCAEIDSSIAIIVDSMRRHVG